MTSSLFDGPGEFSRSVRSAWGLVAAGIDSVNAYQRLLGNGPLSNEVAECCEQSLTLITNLAPVLGQRAGGNEREADLSPIIHLVRHFVFRFRR
jgi:hypothetical protein